MSTTTVRVCSHGQIVSVAPFPDTRIWHTETRDFCTDRPETIRTAEAVQTIVPGTLR